MKTITFILLFISLFYIGSCTQVVLVKSNPNGKVPLGQMKKATGAKSAKAYAPGQQKKKNKKH